MSGWVVYHSRRPPLSYPQKNNDNNDDDDNNDDNNDNNNNVALYVITLNIR